MFKLALRKDRRLSVRVPTVQRFAEAERKYQRGAAGCHQPNRTLPVHVPGDVRRGR